MRAYEVLVTPDAYEDMAAIRDHVAKTISRAAAQSVLRSLRETMSSLGTMPARVKVVEDEPWHSRGVRRILSGNFFLYFRIVEEDAEVHVLNVLYARRG